MLHKDGRVGHNGHYYTRMEEYITMDNTTQGWKSRSQ